MISKEQKEKFFEYLEETGTILTAAQKAGIGRATVYRLRRDNEEFRKQIKEAQSTARELINDVAENNIKSRVMNGDFKATTYWLEHNHKNYIRRIGKVKEFRDKRKTLADLARAFHSEGRDEYGKQSLLALMDLSDDDPIDSTK